MTGPTRLYLELGVALAALAIAAGPARPLLAQAGHLTVKQVRVIDAPRVFHPGADDKAGYWEDFGLTTGFDFNLATNRLVAAIKKVNAPPRLFVFDLTTGAIKHRPLLGTTARMEVKSVRLSPDGTIAAIPMGRSRKFSLWNVATGTKITEAAVDGDVDDVDWHPSGTTLVVVADRYIELWRFEKGVLERQRQTRASRDSREFPMTARWSPDGAHIAIGTNYPALYISKGDGTTQSPTLSPMPRGAVQHLAWSPSGDRIAATGGEIAIWSDPKTAVDSPFEKKYALLHKFTPSPRENLRALAWDPSGAYVVFGDGKSNAAIWDAATGAKLAAFSPHPKAKMLEAHWKGGFLITVGEFPDKHFRIWSVTK